MARRPSFLTRYLDELARQERATRRTPPVATSAPAAWGDGYRAGYAQAMVDVASWAAQQASDPPKEQP